ncbi:MAG: hypothetical protein E7318_04495 [Clostridiales bacterium]|nr:hypothetical protein [Clostridiales bacterium]
MRLLDWLLPDLSDIISDVLESVLPKCGPKYEDDLIATLTKAHLGKLPKGKYAEQFISAKAFSRDELRIPLDVETLRRMDDCVKVHKHDVQLRTVSSRLRVSGKGQISISLSLQFAGETADGEKVNVSIGHALLMAYIERDKVRGMALRTLKEVK